MRETPPEVIIAKAFGWIAPPYRDLAMQQQMEQIMFAAVDAAHRLAEP